MLRGNEFGKTLHTTVACQIKQTGLGLSNTDTSLLKMEYYGSATQNNGALRAEDQRSGHGPANCQSYSYDMLNRLQSSIETYNGGTRPGDRLLATTPLAIEGSFPIPTKRRSRVADRKPLTIR